MNQQDTIENLRKGSATVFSEVVNEFQEMVFNTAISIVQNEEDAEDITQEVFVKLHESISGFREEAALSTWLYRVTINKALDHEKKKQTQKRGGFLRAIFYAPQQEPAHFEHPGVLAENKEKAAMLFKALKKIPASQRIAFILHKIEGRSYAEVASITGTTIMAVESLMARAKINLKKTLQNWYEKNK